jgi:hypothetical protein
MANVGPIRLLKSDRIWYNISMSLTPLLNADFSLSRTLVILLAVAAVAAYDLFQRLKHHDTHLLFAFVFGTIISVGLIRTVSLFLQPGPQDNPYAMALCILLLGLGWKTLFGPWRTETKVTVLGTFLFWVVFAVMLHETKEDRIVSLIAAAAALVPAAVWSRLFLKYHAERLSAVMLMFFAGMLSTFPILLYDAFVRRGIELQFFLFRVTPESFSRNSQVFVAGELMHGAGGSRTLLLAGLLSFVIVGLIEEVSKYWVLSRSGRRLFSSIDDVMQLSIIVAIGFAFAENVVNPMYFPGFVRQYLLLPGSPDVLGFSSNVLGRSVLTSMVHILATGVMGYFLGLAIFAKPYLAERRADGKDSAFLGIMHNWFGLDEWAVFRVQMLLTGLLCAVVIHGVFNFLVTLPDLLPGRPSNFGQAFGVAEGNPLHWIPLLIVPSLLYVVGGFWLLTYLFQRRTSMEERGHLVAVEEFVVEK